MKYGEHLKENIAPEYGPEPYLDYSRLDDTIRVLSAKASASASADHSKRQVSLTTPPPTNAHGIPQNPATITEEVFFSAIDLDLAKVEQFTLNRVMDLRKSIDAIESLIELINLSDDTEVEGVQAKADEVAESFLRLEKYVNINFMGFHKILKKHDKYCPAHPCKTFYVARMHSQAWVRGDYSDVVVRLSAIYSAMRRDETAEETADASQCFLRSTTKYWIKTEDVSRVKYAVLRHLPVFLQKTSTGESDSQLTNSVYLDNDQLELYHGRLDKIPGAQAIRLRWYGASDPHIVFVERKTHREKWTGEISVKERFMIKEKEVRQIMNNTYPIHQKRAEMLERGATQAEVDDWDALTCEVSQVIETKQLVPTMRTQYMRTAFQIPFDATVRVSLDTNLCMISERGYDLEGNTVWHRDQNRTLAPTEITRFPHAVLEVKLELKGENVAPPRWVTDLQNSGMLYEVHKFSKFIHGCSTLLPEDVQCVPYWVDDISVRDSIIASGGGKILVRSDLDEKEKRKLKNAGSGPGANQIYDHLLPFGDIEHDKTTTAIGRTSASISATKDTHGGVLTRKKQTAVGNYGMNFYSDPDLEDEEIIAAGNGCIGEEDTCIGWLFPFCSPHNDYYLSVLAPTSVQKIEPKLFFANERTYLHWLHAGITLYAISASILAMTADEQESERWTDLYAMALLLISLGFCMYALHVFLWRAKRIRTRTPGRWDDPRGPMLLGGVFVGVLTINFFTNLYEILNYGSMKGEL